MLDLLFNMVVGLAAMFYIAFILINPPTKRNDAPKKAEFLITMEWNSTWDDDVDLWIKGPDGNTMSFKATDRKYLFLERDDRGWLNDTTIFDGKERLIDINREVATIRGIIPGEYKIAAHVYQRKGDTRDAVGSVRIAVIKLNPYAEIFTKDYDYSAMGQVIPVVNFSIDAEGNYTGSNYIEHNIVVDDRGIGERNAF